MIKIIYNSLRSVGAVVVYPVLWKSSPKFRFSNLVSVYVAAKPHQFGFTWHRMIKYYPMSPSINFWIPLLIPKKISVLGHTIWPAANNFLFFFQALCIKCFIVTSQKVTNHSLIQCSPKIKVHHYNFKIQPQTLLPFWLC